MLMFDEPSLMPQVYESCMALGMLPTMQACTPRNASCEFAIVGDAATAVAAIRCEFSAAFQQHVHCREPDAVLSVLQF